MSVRPPARPRAMGRGIRPRGERARRPGPTRSGDEARRRPCDRLHREDGGGERRGRPRSGGAPHQHRPSPRALPRHRGAHRPHRPHGRGDRGGERYAGRGVQHLGGPGGRASRLHERARRDDGRARRHAQGTALPAEGGRAARSRARGRTRRGPLRLLPGHHQRMYGWEGSPVHDALAVAHVVSDRFLQTDTATWRWTSARSRAAAARTSISGSGRARSRTATSASTSTGPGSSTYWWTTEVPEVIGSQTRSRAGIGRRMMRGGRRLPAADEEGAGAVDPRRASGRPGRRRSPGSRGAPAAGRWCARCG